MNVKSKAALSTFVAVVIPSLYVGVLVYFIMESIPFVYTMVAIAIIAYSYLIKGVYDHFVWKYEREQK
jgi:hypothetical protein